MVSVCTGLLGEEGRVSTLVDPRLQTEYLYLSHDCFCCLYSSPFDVLNLIVTSQQITGVPRENHTLSSSHW